MVRRSNPSTLLIGILWLVLACAPAAGARAADLAVDLQLVLAVDVSSSMNEIEQQIQRAGYVAAITDPVVAAAIGSGPLGRIAVTYMEWAGPGHQSIVVPWRLIDGEAGARAFAAALASKPLTQGTGTSISASLIAAAGLFQDNDYESRRRIIDLSGDGPNNIGLPVVQARNAVAAEGIVINGLPLMLQPSPTGFAVRPDLIDYFRDCVIAGPGAFVLPANSTVEIATAIRQKLVQEIAALRPVRMMLAAAPVEPIRADCMIGQKDFNE